MGNTIDYNLWFADAGAAAARFVWNGTEYAGFAAYRAATGQDAHSLFADPLLANPGAGDFHLTGSSPAIDAGDPAFVADPGETDLDGGARVLGPRVDMRRRRGQPVRQRHHRGARAVRRRQSS